MRVSDWQQVEELFHSALTLRAENRTGYLDEACAGDESLRREVESLLDYFEGGASFIEEPALSLGMKVLSHEPASSLVGKSLGRYKILRLLGVGGMGEVYLAEDVKLERNVALKFIAGTLVDDEWAKEQLRKEARAVAKLEDPNICAVHGIEEVDGHEFIVMQYVEGQSLDSLIQQGGFEPARALDVAEQMARALSAAHARAIIHRDVKPHNIIVTTGGQVKVLDFGLAKLSRQGPAVGELGGADPSTTLQLGLVVGTVAYMSPEQARAEELDTRSDIFSLGIVFYELLCGVNPFKRDDGEETLAAIKAENPPPLTTRVSSIPVELDRIVRKCLEKNREQRYQTVDDLLLDLRRLRRDSAAGSPLARAEARRHRYRRFGLPALAVALLLVAGVGFAYLELTQARTLAVLPVINATGDPNVDYLSDGLTRNLAYKFSQLSRLHVRAPAVLDQAQNADPAAAGRQLQAEDVLVGQIVKQDDTLRLQTRLYDTSDNSLLWEESSELDPTQVTALQDKIALKTTGRLLVWLSGDEEKVLTKHHTDSEAALSLYMRGVHYWNRRDEKNIRLAIEMFGKALEIDPSFAQAYAGLADSYVLLSTVAYGPERTDEVIDKARAAVTKALQRDVMLCEAHTSLGVIKLRYDWKWQEAENEFRFAIKLNPDYAPAHLWYSHLLTVTGRYDEAIRESETFKRLEPFAPSSITNLGRAYYCARQYDQAVDSLKQALEKYPNYESGLYMLGLVYLKKGMYREGIDTLRTLYALHSIYAAAPLGYAYARIGRSDEAFDVLDGLEKAEKVPGAKPIPPQEKAIIYMGLRNNDMVFKYLEEAYRERFSSLISLASDPLFDDLRSDPRFFDLARRMNLTP